MKLVNRFTITSAIAWLFAVALLWYMIKIVSENSRWLEIGTGELSEVPVAEPVVSAVSNIAAPSCQETEISLRERVETARYCTTDNDCTLFDFGYPIDCMTSVAKSEITDLRYEYRRYEQSCAFRVYFDCPAEPMERRAVCQENRCSVSLQANDMLEEETLDYLGIGGSGQKK